MSAIELSRRAFLGLAWTAPAAAPAALSAHTIHRAHNPSYEVTETARKHLKAIAHSTSNQVKHNGFDHPLKFDNKEIVVRPNAPAIMETLLQIAYVDGGTDTVKNTLDFIKAHGLLIERFDRMTAGLFGTGEVHGYMKPASDNHPLIIGLSRALLEGYYQASIGNDPSTDPDRTWRHELQHVVQQSRHPHYYQLARLGELATFVAPITYPYIATMNTLSTFFSPYSSTRRRLLIAGMWIAATAATLKLGSDNKSTIDRLNWQLSNTEQEAYIREDVLKKSLKVDDIRGKLLSFRRV